MGRCVILSSFIAKSVAMALHILEYRVLDKASFAGFNRLPLKSMIITLAAPGAKSKNLECLHHSSIKTPTLVLQMVKNWYFS